MDSFVGSVCESEGRETTTPVKIDKALQHPQQLLLRVAVQEANEAADQAAVAKGIRIAEGMCGGTSEHSNEVENRLTALH